MEVQRKWKAEIMAKRSKKPVGDQSEMSDEGPKRSAGRPPLQQLNKRQIEARLHAVIECGERASRALTMLGLLVQMEETITEAVPREEQMASIDAPSRELTMPSAHADTESRVRYLLSFIDRVCAEIRERTQ